MDEWTDIIHNFMEYTEGLPSPEIFRLWSAITMISGALERRVWVETARSLLYPNLYVLLVAPPAVGKSISVSEVSKFWYDAKKFHIAPSNATKASLIDCIAKADGKKLVNGVLVEYHSLLAASSEFGVMVPAHDLEFLSVLTDIFDCPARYSEERRSLSKQIDIVNPQLTIIAGTQPAYMASMIPEEAWGQGFTSRLIMIYASSAPKVKLFSTGFVDPRSALRKTIVDQLKKLSELFGRATWDADAMELLENWAAAGCPPEPTHSKLNNYNGRRVLHIIKLSLIAAVSRSGKTNISLPDVQRAMDWLFQAEELMPDIFRDMQQKSDTQVIQELHFFLWRIWLKEKTPIHEGRVIHFLSTRIPTEKILKLIEIAERGKMILRDAGTQSYTPRPQHEHGIE